MPIGQLVGRGFRPHGLEVKARGTVYLEDIGYAESVALKDRVVFEGPVNLDR